MFAFFLLVTFFILSRCADSSTRYKVVLYGATGVGKTSILARLMGGGFDTNTVTSFGASYEKMDRTLEDGTTAAVEFWDTAGQERFHALAPMYLRDANVILAVFDLTHRDSIIYLRRLSYELCRAFRNEWDLPVVLLIGNKSDLEYQRTFLFEESEKLKEELKAAAYYDVSAKSNINIKGLCDDTIKFAATGRSQSRKHHTQRTIRVGTKDEQQPAQSGCCLFSANE